MIWNQLSKEWLLFAQWPSRAKRRKKGKLARGRKRKKLEAGSGAYPHGPSRAEGAYVNFVSAAGEYWSFQEWDPFVHFY